MTAEADQQTSGPQIVLVTPALPGADFGDHLGACLDAVDIACLRIAIGSKSEDDWARAADLVREIAYARDVAVVVERHLALVERHGLDGVHLTDGARQVRAARKALGADAIVGAFCGNSRHDGITAGEQGADYVALGPVAAGALTAGMLDGAVADRDLFAWWTEMIEVPVIAEGGLTPALIRDLAPVTDFIALGEEIWAADNPAAALRDLVAAMG